MADQIWVELVGDMIVVPNSKLAYMARLAFGHGTYRVFYNDMMAAIHWLGQPSAPLGA